MPKTIRFHETGGAQVLKVEDLPLTEPGEGEVRMKVEAIGLKKSSELATKYDRWALVRDKAQQTVPA